MNQALSQSNMTELQLASHTLKSSSALVGAARLSGLCEQLEGQAREAVQHSLDILPNVYEKFSQIQAEYNRVEKALEIELSKQ
jgi:HPt (histidine-containing phosphotransfer) domain-containing protein